MRTPCTPPADAGLELSLGVRTSSIAVSNWIAVLSLTSTLIDTLIAHHSLGFLVDRPERPERPASNFRPLCAFVLYLRAWAVRNILGAKETPVMRAFSSACTPVCDLSSGDADFPDCVCILSIQMTFQGTDILVMICVNWLGCRRWSYCRRLLCRSRLGAFGVFDDAPPIIKHHRGRTGRKPRRVFHIGGGI